MCIIGGRQQERAVLCFNGTSWSLVEEATFPDGRYYAAGAYLNGNPCVIGGYVFLPVEERGSRNTTFCYVSGTWEEWPSLNQARHDHQILEIGGKTCVAGGIVHPPGTKLSSVECWYGNQWRKNLIPDLSEPRFRHTAIYVKGYPCVALGVGSGIRLFSMKFTYLDKGITG